MVRYRLRRRSLSVGMVAMSFSAERGYMELQRSPIVIPFSAAPSCRDAVDDVGQRFAAKPLGCQFCGRFAQRPNGPRTGGGDVRCEDDVGHLEQRMARRDWLRIADIQGGRGQMPA